MVLPRETIGHSVNALHRKNKSGSSAGRWPTTNVASSSSMPSACPPPAQAGRGLVQHSGYGAQNGFKDSSQIPHAWSVSR